MVAAVGAGRPALLGTLRRGRGASAGVAVPALLCIARTFPLVQAAQKEAGRMSWEGRAYRVARWWRLVVLPSCIVLVRKWSACVAVLRCVRVPMAQAPALWYVRDTSRSAKH